MSQKQTHHKTSDYKGGNLSRVLYSRVAIATTQCQVCHHNDILLFPRWKWSQDSISLATGNTENIITMNLLARALKETLGKDKRTWSVVNATRLNTVCLSVRSRLSHCLPSAQKTCFSKLTSAAELWKTQHHHPCALLQTEIRLLAPAVASSLHQGTAATRTLSPPEKHTCLQFRFIKYTSE